MKATIQFKITKILNCAPLEKQQKEAIATEVINTNPIFDKLLEQGWSIETITE